MSHQTTRRRQWIGCAGCLLVLAALAALFMRVGGAFAFALVTVAVAGLGSLAAALFVERLRAIAAFRAAYRGSGKDVLIVYTESPLWKEYIESRWLSRWGDRAIVLDRSKPWSNDQPEARLWRAVAGSVEHTPVVIVVPARGRVQIVRFWLAFRDFKHGKEQKLRDAEARLARILDDHPR
jgi:hypothetical protein